MMSSLTLKYLDLLEQNVITVDETIRLLKNKAAVVSPDGVFAGERFTFNPLFVLRENHYEIFNAF